MDDEANRSVVDAVFELREAAIAHGQVLEQLERDDDPALADALLESQLDLEEKTAAAIDECVEDKTETAPAVTGTNTSNLIEVDFTSRERAPDTETTG